DRVVDMDEVKRSINALQARGEVKCMTFTGGDDKNAGVVNVTAHVFNTGSKMVKCLFDTGADVAMVGEEWLKRCGYLVDMDFSSLSERLKKKLFKDFIVKADTPLKVTVFGGGIITCTHFVVLKICALRGEGKKFNQATM
ncbi:hypothetical protein ADUPG1_003148, partial [Aduncisulcus paluster]